MGRAGSVRRSQGAVGVAGIAFVGLFLLSTLSEPATSVVRISPRRALLGICPRTDWAAFGFRPG